MHTKTAKHISRDPSRRFCIDTCSRRAFSTHTTQLRPSGRRILPPGECFLERKRIRRLARRQGRADDTRPDTERAGVGTHTEIPGHADKNAPCAPQRQRIPRYYTRRSGRATIVWTRMVAAGLMRILPVHWRRKSALICQNHSRQPVYSDDSYHKRLSMPSRRPSGGSRRHVRLSPEHCQRMEAFIGCGMRVHRHGRAYTLLFF